MGKQHNILNLRFKFKKKVKINYYITGYILLETGILTVLKTVQKTHILKAKGFF